MREWKIEDKLTGRLGIGDKIAKNLVRLLHEGTSHRFYLQKLYFWSKSSKKDF